MSSDSEAPRVESGGFQDGTTYENFFEKAAELDPQNADYLSGLERARAGLDQFNFQIRAARGLLEWTYKSSNGTTVAGAAASNRVGFGNFSIGPPLETHFEGNGTFRLIVHASQRATLELIPETPHLGSIAATGVGRHEGLGSNVLFVGRFWQI
ncbi:hypothetical protein PLICRDRAFT_533933 [Plicaturopsis crispa FD-325 SS-3]|nr:hypothetical protein PLICRDRAFT_533933 [Plicaturopsis crispa FD-325 SS-3]